MHAMVLHEALIISLRGPGAGVRGVYSRPGACLSWGWGQGIYQRLIGRLGGGVS